MQPSFRWTDGKDRDFQSFWLKTEEYYNHLVGGAGNRKAFMQYNISESVTYVLIAYDGDAAIGCAGLKPYSGSSQAVCETRISPHSELPAV